MPTKMLSKMNFFGELTFDFKKEKSIPESLRKELTESSHLHKPITKDQAQIVAEAVYSWAVSKGCTHFCHWFHPLTGSTAEKHDGFISFSDSQTLDLNSLRIAQKQAAKLKNNSTKSSRYSTKIFESILEFNTLIYIVIVTQVL